MHERTMNKFDSYDEKKLNKVHWVLDQVSLYHLDSDAQKEWLGGFFRPRGGWWLQWHVLKLAPCL